METVIVRNVDQSPLVYDLFEEKHHLLESLTKRQLELIVPSHPQRILDIGCGTGISAMAISNMLASSDRPPRIFAIDISESMLSKAKERYRNIPGLYFIWGDA
ncbi:MAG: class I SAM-dependent methyltransferase, partial [Deltaproteobacteria bacterium]|nr:class I SAM-dependent methyltransferase [Deltaproteobacteria bacterium]